MLGGETNGLLPGYPCYPLRSSIHSTIRCRYKPKLWTIHTGKLSIEHVHVLSFAPRTINNNMYIICCSTWLDIYIMFKCSQLKLPKISWDIIFPWLYRGCGHGQVWEIQLGIFASWIEDEWNHEMQCDAHYCHYFRYSSIAKAIAKYFEKVPQLNVKHNLQQWIHCQAHTSRLGQR